MEKQSKKTYSIFLPLIHHIQQLRQHYFLYDYIIFIVEASFLLSFPFRHSLLNSDHILTSIAVKYMELVIHNQIVIYSFYGLFFLLLVLISTAFLCLLAEKKLEFTSPHRLNAQKIKNVCAGSFVTLEIVVTPTLLLTLTNIRSHLSGSAQLLTFLTLPFALILYLSERKRRIFEQYLIIFFLAEALSLSLVDFLIVAVVSAYLGVKEVKMHKKILFCFIAIWETAIILCNVFKTEITFIYLIVFAVAVVCIVAFKPEESQVLGSVEENSIIIRLIEKIEQNKDLSLREKIEALKIIQKFNEEPIQYGQNQADPSQKGKNSFNEQNLTKQGIFSFLLGKIRHQLRKQYSNWLKMQQLQSQVAFSKFNMSILYQIQKLVQEMRQESTYQQQKKLFELVDFTDKKFLKKEQSFNVATFISIEKSIEALYEYFINIPILMQQFWVLQRRGNMNERMMSTILLKVSTMQQECQRIIQTICKFNCARHQIMIYEYLKRLVNNSHKSREFEEIEASRQDFSHVENSNYILIQEGRIIEMSNQLLNQFKITKQQAQGYKLTDIITDQMAQYLNSHLDKIVQKEIRNQETSLILPLKISHDQKHIQPFRTTIELLPQLINGIKYIIHLDKSKDLQKTPYFLYSSNDDNIIGATKNFKQYFKFQRDNFLFTSFSHQLFNIDIGSFASNRQKQSESIICELKVKRQTGKLESQTKNKTVMVIIKMIKHYEINQNHLILINIVKKEDYEKTELNNLISEKMFFASTEKEINFNYRNGESEEMDYKGSEITFCKIPNPYQNLIEEKISKMSEFYRLSYSKIMALGIAGILICFTVTLSLMSSEMSNFSTSMLKYLKLKMASNELTTNTFMLYFHSAQHYHIVNYPNHYLSIDPAYDWSVSLYSLQQKVNSDIKNILSQHLRNEIQFNHHPINGVYDSLKQAKAQLITHNMSGLLKTWKNYTDNTQSVQILSYILNLISYFEQFNLYSCLFLTIVILILGYNIYNLNHLHHQILYLYQQINSQQSSKFIDKYRVFIHQLYSSHYFRGIRSNEYLQLYTNRKELKSIEEMGTLCYLEDTVHLQLQKDKQLQNEQKKDAKQSSIIEKQLLFSFIWKESYVYLFVFITAAVFLSIATSIERYQVQFQNISVHTAELNYAKGNISYNGAFYLISSLQNTLQPEDRMQYIKPSQMYLQSDFYNSLPSFYSAYMNKLTLRLHEDLCPDKSLKSSSLYTRVECESICSGRLKMGFPQSIIMYNDLVNSHSFTPMEEFNSTYYLRSGFKAKYPVFLEIFYTRKTLFDLIGEIQAEFARLTEQFISIQNQTLASYLKACWGLLPIFLIISCILFTRINKKCSVSLKSFFILPKQYLLERKVTKILKQKRILDQIERLAF